MQIIQKTNNKNMQRTNRIFWIDQMRGLAMIWVYFAHVGIPSYYYGLFSYWFIPYFFFLSGYLHKDETTIKQLRKRITNRLLVPYILFSIIPIISSLLENTNKDSITNNIIALVTGRGNWFFACIITMEIISFCLSKIICMYPLYRNKIISIIIIIGVISMYMVQPRSEIWWHADTAICAMTYYYSGYIYRRSSLNQYQGKWSYVALFILTIISMFIYINKILDFNVSINIFGEPIINLILAITGSITTALFLQKINIKGHILSFLGQNTIWLYGINYYMLSIANKISDNIGITTLNLYIYVPIKVALAIAIGSLLVIPINRWFPWANGKTKQIEYKLYK